jgi:hypothetical protein
VPTPPAALLGDAAAATFASDMADALVKQEIPAIAHKALTTDWKLDITATQKPQGVVPTYTVIDPKGAKRGSNDGPPVPPAQWAAGDPVALAASAQAAAPGIAALLQHIETARLRADPNSLLNRAARVIVPEVTGAPGDGNARLTMEMRRDLPLLGDVVQDSTEGADFIVQGQVRVVPAEPGKQRVEIQWILKTAAGDERGRVIQLNEIDAGTLDHFWGDVAVEAAKQAAGGIHQAILTQSGRTAAAAEAAGAAGAGQKPAQPGQVQPAAGAPAREDGLAVPPGDTGLTQPKPVPAKP